MKSLIFALSAISLALPIAAGAQENSSLEVTVNTGVPPGSTPVSKKPPTKPIPAPNRGTLASRGGRPQEPQPAPMTLSVRPGTVTFAAVQVRASRAPDSRVLSTATKGQNLAVLSEMEGLYGVLMVNNTVGWVPKEAIQLMDYHTDVTLAAPSPTSPPSLEAPTNTSGLSEKQRQVIREAFTYMGVPYVWAGNGRAGLDCSAFVKNVFSTVGVTLPRHSGDQLALGRTITDTGELLASDRLYFAMKGGTTITHTGIYLGEGLFIHASSNHGRVDVDALFKTNYINKLVAIRRD